MNVIYKIENLKTNTIYIGKTGRLKDRKTEHFSKLKCNRHYNKHLQRSYNKYGKKNFKFSVVECILDNNTSYINSREQYWISFYNSFEEGFNQSFGGDGGAGYNKGVSWSNEVKTKISKSKKSYYKNNKPHCSNQTVYVYKKGQNLFVGPRYKLKQMLNNQGLKVSSSHLSRLEKDHSKNCRGWKILACNLNK